MWPVMPVRANDCRRLPLILAWCHKRVKMGAKPLIAIACGGTGGHLFPGIAVGEVLRARNCAVTLLVSQKEVDQHAVQTSPRVNFLALPAVGMQGGNWAAFLRGFAQSFFAARELF